MTRVPTLEVFRNGRRVAIAGVANGSVHVITHLRLGDHGLPRRSARPKGPVFTTNVSGSDPVRRVHSTWWSRRLQAGDEILVRASAAGEVSTPTRRSAFTKRRTRRTGDVELCSFCDRWRGDREADAPSMAYGHGASICAICVFLAIALLEARATKGLWLRTTRGPCPFCDRKPRGRLVGGRHGVACAPCIKRFKRHF